MKFILPLIFIGIPIAEIAMFIQVGDLIGLWPTLATIVLTAIVGTAILRHQGLSTLAKAQSSLDHGQLPLDSVIHGAFLLIAGVLLLTPGFLTDAVGFAFLIPPVRLSIAQRIMKLVKRSDHVHVHAFDMDNFDGKTTRPRGAGPGHRAPGAPGPIIEGEFVESDDTTAESKDPNSPWRQ